MVARPMSSNRASVAKARGSSTADKSAVDRFLTRELVKLQLRRKISSPQYLIPRMDLYQDDDLPNAFALLELPGVSPGDLRVVVSEGFLVVKGYRAPPLESHLARVLRLHQNPEDHNQPPVFPLSESKYVTRQLNFGKFLQKVRLPPGTQAESVRYEFQDGILFVTWPRHSPQGTDGTSIHVSHIVSDEDTSMTQAA